MPDTAVGFAPPRDRACSSCSASCSPSRRARGPARPRPTPPRRRAPAASQLPARGPLAGGRAPRRRPRVPRRRPAGEPVPRHPRRCSSSSSASICVGARGEPRVARDRARLARDDGRPMTTGPRTEPPMTARRLRSTRAGPPSPRLRVPRRRRDAAADPARAAGASSCSRRRSPTSPTASRQRCARLLASPTSTATRSTLPTCAADR